MAEGYVGLKEFRDIGGSLIAEVSRSGNQLDVGTSASNRLMRLRAVSQRPKTASRVPRERVLRFDTVKQNITAVRAIIACGGKFVFLSKGDSRVLVDRPQGFDHGMIDAYVDSLQKEAVEQAYGEIKDQISALGSKIVGTGTGPAFIAELEEKYAHVLKQLQHYMFGRGADAQVEEKSKRKADDLEGFTED